MGSNLIDRCLHRRRQELERIDEFREGGGKTLGYLCQGFPPAVAAGLGFRPVRVLPALSRESIVEGEKRVRPDVCPMIKALLGAILSGSDAAGKIDVWAGMHTCDQSRRLFQELEWLSDAMVLPLQLPSTRSKRARAYYIDQVLALSRTAEESGLSAGYDPGAARTWETARSRAASLLASILERPLADPVLGRAVLDLWHVSDSSRFLAFLEQIIEEIGADDSSPSPIVGSIGSAVSTGDHLLEQVIGERGGTVAPLGCTSLASLFSGGENPTGDIESLAGMAFDHLRCARSRPNAVMFDYLEEMLAKTGASGMVLKTLRFCDLWFTERERIRDRIDLPVLVLDTDCSAGEEERLRNRIEAFLDTLKVRNG